VPAVAPPTPVALHGTELEAVVAGSLVGEPTAEPVAPPPGSPRSPDGKLLVAVTPLGLIVTGREPPELWQAAELGSFSEVTDCVLAPDATAIACIQAGHVVLLRR
jgi:hypothetical protein